jgi:hypothetical protein
MIHTASFGRPFDLIKNTLLVIFSGSPQNAKRTEQVMLQAQQHASKAKKSHGTYCRHTQDANTHSLVPASLIAGAFDMTYRDLPLPLTRANSERRAKMEVLRSFMVRCLLGAWQRTARKVK